MVNSQENNPAVCPREEVGYAVDLQAQGQGTTDHPEYWPEEKKELLQEIKHLEQRKIQLLDQVDNLEIRMVMLERKRIHNRKRDGQLAIPYVRSVQPANALGKNGSDTIDYQGSCAACAREDRYKDLETKRPWQE